MNFSLSYPLSMLQFLGEAALEGFLRAQPSYPEKNKREIARTSSRSGFEEVTSASVLTTFVNEKKEKMSDREQRLKP